jgi:hypothetical protein
MRTAFFVLLLANAVFFAWSQYFSPTEAAAEGVLARRNEPDKLKIVPPAGPAQVPLTQKPAASLAAMAGCLEWGGFTLTDYARAEKALEILRSRHGSGKSRASSTAASCAPARSFHAAP